MLIHIEYLRFLAVTAVFLFHANYLLFPGGFVGVDVFFVVSGYLMAYLSLKKPLNEFNPINFIWKRFSRLVTLTIILCLLVLFFNIFLQAPYVFKDYFASFYSALGFFSNFTFFQEEGYFNVSSKLDPLLHTWTLGVEFQFYVCFALFFYLSRFFHLNIAFIALGILSIISFSLNFIFAQNTGAVFYLLPARGWEFGLGAMLAYLPYLLPNRPIPSTGLQTKIKTPSKLLIIVILGTISLWGFNVINSRLFFTLIIVFITLAIIASSYKFDFGEKEHPFNKFIISAGRLSFPIYIVHYPIIQLSSPYLESFPTTSKILLWGFSSIVLAKIFDNFDEMCRNFLYSIRKIKKQLLLLSSYAALCVFAFLSQSFFLDLNNNLAEKNLKSSTMKINEFYSYVIDERADYAANFKSSAPCWQYFSKFDENVIDKYISCSKLYGPGIILYGDSHAEGLYFLLERGEQNLADYPFFFAITKGGCRYFSKDENCNFSELEYFAEKNTEIIKKVLYNQAGFYLFKSGNVIGRNTILERTDSTEINKQRIRELFNIFKNKSYSKKINIIGPWQDPFITRRETIEKGCDGEFKLNQDIVLLYKDLDEELARNASNLNYKSLMDYIKFDESSDYANCDEIYWADSDHMTVNGFDRFKKRFSLRDLVD